jgi:hypothetical protein
MPLGEVVAKLKVAQQLAYPLKYEITETLATLILTSPACVEKFNLSDKMPLGQVVAKLKVAQQLANPLSYEITETLATLILTSPACVEKFNLSDQMTVVQVVAKLNSYKFKASPLSYPTKAAATVLLSDPGICRELGFSGTTSEEMFAHILELRKDRGITSYFTREPTPERVQEVLREARQKIAEIEAVGVQEYSLKSALRTINQSILTTSGHHYANSELVDDRIQCLAPGECNRWIGSHPSVKFEPDFKKLMAILREVLPWKIHHIENMTGCRLVLARLHSTGRKDDSGVYAQSDMTRTGAASLPIRGTHPSHARGELPMLETASLILEHAGSDRCFLLTEGVSMITSLDHEPSIDMAQRAVVQRFWTQSVELGRKSQFFRQLRVVSDVIHGNRPQKRSKL